MQEIEKVKITTEFIKLDQCLKWLAVVGSGSEAKEIIINEEVKVNGEIEVDEAIAKELLKNPAIEEIKEVQEEKNGNIEEQNQENVEEHDEKKKGSKK